MGVYRASSPVLYLQSSHYFIQHHTNAIADKHHYIFRESIALEILKLKKIACIVLLEWL